MATWRLIVAECLDDPALNYALDMAIAEHVARGVVPPTVRLWQPGRCLALGRFDSRLPHFPEAVQHMKGLEIIVVQRMSGGKAVWQDKGYLNFSVIIPGRSKTEIPETYHEFSEGLMLGLRALGVKAAFEKVEGAFCDGPYDLAVEGKKLVGTAQVQKRGFVIVQGTMLVDCDLDKMIQMISEFYAHTGQPIRLRKEAMTTLAEELHRAVGLDELVQALREGYRHSLGELIDAEPLQSEWARAKELRGMSALS